MVMLIINSTNPPHRNNNNYYYYNNKGYTSIIMFLLFNFYALSWSEAIPEDSNISSHPANFHFNDHIFDNSDDGSFISAFLNVTFKTEYGWKWDKTEVGRYGGTFIGPSYGLLVHVSSPMNPDDHSGCVYPLLSSRADGKIPGKPWIALIKRGHCNFETKVENAFRSKASGVLIYNDRDSSSLDKMQLSSDSRRNISAVFIYKWKGEELVKLSSNGSNVYVHISVAGHTSSQTANINRTSVLFVSVTFIVLIIITLTWLVFYYVRRFQYIRSKDRLNRKLGNAAKKALSKIPTKNIKSGDKLKGEGECCAICIEFYKSGDTIRLLPCLHEFHKPCIDPWLLEHRTCPMCKMDILKHYGFVCTGSHESILHFGLSDDHSGENPHAPLSPQRNGLSPLPEIRIITHHVRPAQYDNSVDDDSSRASTPNEMTPSLHLNNDELFTQSSSNKKLIETTAIVPTTLQQPTSKSKRCLNCGTPCDPQHQQEGEDPSTSTEAAAPERGGRTYD